MWSRLRTPALVAVAALACVAGIAACVRLSVIRSANGMVFHSVGAIPARPVGLVFGAGLTPDGSPTPMLADRVDAAIALYRTGKVSRLLFSGDNSRPDYDEVGAMLSYALSKGMPGSAITLDHAGFDTYDSCYRARAIFGVRAAVLVTQAFHMPRALYDCSHLGIDAVGLSTPDWGSYDTGMMLGLEAREALASVKAAWDVNVAHRAPALLGPYLGMR